MNPNPRRRDGMRKLKWRELSWSEWIVLLVVPVFVVAGVLTPGYILRRSQQDLSNQFATAIVTLQTQHALLEADIQRSIRELRCILTIPTENRNPIKLHRCAARA